MRKWEINILTLVTEILHISGGTNFEIRESNLKENGMLWVSGKYGYTKKYSRDCRIFLRCRSYRHAKCKGTAVVKCDEDPAELIETKPHNCGGSADVPWAHFTEKKGKKKPRKDKEIRPILITKFT